MVTLTGEKIEKYFNVSRYFVRKATKENKLKPIYNGWATLYELDNVISVFGTPTEIKEILNKEIE